MTSWPIPVTRFSSSLHPAAHSSLTVTMLTTYVFGALLLAASSLANPVAFKSKTGVALVFDDLEVALNTSLKIANDASALDTDETKFVKVYNGCAALGEHFTDSIKNLAPIGKFKGADETKAYEDFELLSHALEGEIDILTYHADTIRKNAECSKLGDIVSFHFTEYTLYAEDFIELLENKTYISDLEELVAEAKGQQSEWSNDLNCPRVRYQPLWEMTMSILGLFIH